MRFVRRHGLSLTVGMFALAFLGLSLPTEEGWWRDFTLGMATSLACTLVLILATKRLREVGSAESK